MCGCVGFFSNKFSINDAKGLLGDFINDIGMLPAHHNITLSQPLPAYIATITSPRPHSVSFTTGLRIRDSIPSTLVQRPSERSLSVRFSYTERICNAK